MPARRLALPLLVAVAAALSLALPFALVFDPWAWLVWGREIAALDLDTGTGPSWKPLPVLLTAAFAPAGDAAGDLWLLVARAGWLTSIVLAWRLAARLALPDRLGTRLGVLLAPRRVRRARVLAGAIAAVGMLLLFDPFTPWLRQFAGGLSEPLLVALVLGAVDRRLSGRPGQALGLGIAAALLRPEAWPFLAAYGVYLWPREPGLRRWLIIGAVAVPALWLAPDLIGSGSPLTGASRAREATGSPPLEALEAIGRSLNLVLAALWVATAYAVLSAWRSGERAIVTLAVGALAWIAVVAALAVVGYAGIPRFAAPAGAIGCVLGGVGAVRLLALAGATARPDPRLVLACAALALAVSVQGALRAAELPGDAREAADHAEDLDQLFAVTDAVGPAALAGCGPTTTTTDFLTETALAWKLELALDRVQLRIATAPPAGIAFVDADAPPVARSAVRAVGRPLAHRERWAAYAISCAGARAIAGVAGAAR